MLRLPHELFRQCARALHELERNGGSWPLSGRPQCVQTALHQFLPHVSEVNQVTALQLIVGSQAIAYVAVQDDGNHGSRKR
jgi:hypothetical protein